MPQSTGSCASDRRITVRVAGVKHRIPVHAPSNTRYRSRVSQSAAAALICVGHCWFRISALPPRHYQALSLCPSSYQQRASVIVASGDRDSRSPRAKGDSREVLPHLCAPKQPVTALSDPPLPLLQHSNITSAGHSQGWGLPLLPSPRWRV